MRVLVTGARGLLGTQLVKALRTEGHEVLATDVFMGCSDDYVTWDVSAPPPTDVRAFSPDVIYHLAAVCGRVVAEECPELALRTNVLGAQQVADFADRWGARLIHLSTSEVYGDAEEREGAAVNPRNWYGVTKSLGEVAVQYWCPDATIVRPFMMYHETEPAGPHRSFMIRAAHAIMTGEPITIHQGSARSWLHMQDAVDWLLAMMDDRFAGHTLNIGHPDAPVDNEVLVHRMAATFGRPAKVISAAMPEKIRAVKTPDLTKQQAMLPPPKVSLTQGLIRLYRFMEAV